MKTALILALSVCAAVFAIDVITPVGDTSWIFYTMALLIVSSRTGSILPLGITGLSCILIILGYFLSPPYADINMDIVNRLTGVVVQLVVALVLIHRNRAKEDLQKRTVELEQEIVRRKMMEDELRESQDNLRATLEKERGLQEQLRHAQQMEALGTMAGGIGHDFNNLLSAIIGFTELTVDGLPEGKDKRHLEQVLKAGHRGVDLVKQMLAFSRKTQQGQKPLSLAAIVEETRSLLRASIPTTVDLRVDIQSDSMVLADPVGIQQVLMNLCTNARDAMRERGGILRIELTDVNIDRAGHVPHLAPGLYVELSVTDTGTGIDPDIAQRIFDPFFTTKEVGEGTGLGLSVVHGIVESYGGTITVESKPGEGSTFRVYLPQARENSVKDKEQEDRIPGGNERVLVVDDEKMLVEMAVEMMAELGYEVTGTTSGTEALRLFEQDPALFDLIIADQTMPGITGLVLSERLKEIRKDVPVVLVTGYSQLVNAESIKNAKIDRFLMKPLTKATLARAIREVMDEGRRKTG